MGIFEIIFYIILFIIMIIDIKYKSIYDLHLLLALFSLLFILWDKDWLYHFYGLLIGFSIGYIIYKIAYWYYGQEAFGFGDVLLLGVIGLYLGWIDFFSYFAITNIITGFLGIIFLVLSRGKMLKYELPMAPFFVLGLFLFDYLGRIDLYTCYYLLFEFFN